jgi:hypothetical protein
MVTKSFITAILAIFSLAVLVLLSVAWNQAEYSQDGYDVGVLEARYLKA